MRIDVQIHVYTHTHTVTYTQNSLGRFCTKTCVCNVKGQSDQNMPKSSDSCAWKIAFLGTGASAPFKYRTVSSILVGLNTKSATEAGVNNKENQDCIDGYAMLDAGDGSYGTMVRKYGVEKTDDILCDMKVLFVSHKHADHISGTAKLLLKRKDALAKRGAPHTSSPKTATQTQNGRSCALCAAKFSYSSSLEMHARACHPRAVAQACGTQVEQHLEDYGRETASTPDATPLCEFLLDLLDCSHVLVFFCLVCALWVGPLCGLKRQRVHA
jgi:ribonuclease BN (tRNA processing enzyme)